MLEFPGDPDDVKTLVLRDQERKGSRGGSVEEGRGIWRSKTKWKSSISHYPLRFETRLEEDKDLMTLLGS